MQFIKPDININFIGKRKIAFCISITMILISFISLFIHRGPRYGIDFAGGTLIQIRFLVPARIDQIKAGLATVDLGKSSVQAFGDAKENEYLIRTDKSVMTDEGFTQEIQHALTSATGKDVDSDHVARPEAVFMLLDRGRR